MDTRLLFGVGVGLVSLFLRWRFPSVPKPLATVGIIAGLGLTVWSQSSVPVGLAFSLILNVALIAAILELGFTPKPDTPVATDPPINTNPEQDNDDGLKLAVIEEVLASARAAHAAINNGNEAGMKNAIPGLRATFLTLQKTHDFRILTFPNGARPRRYLQAAVRYFREIDPLLRQDHIDEARQRVNELLPMLDAFIAGGIDDLP